MYVLHSILMLTVAAAIIAADIYAVFATADFDHPSPRPPVWQALLGGVVLGLTNWPFLYGFLFIAGWAFIWGDNYTNEYPYNVGVIAAIGSGMIASTAVTRSLNCQTPQRYWPVLWRTLAATYAIGAIAWLTRPGAWATALTFSPIIISVAGWGMLYRRQLRERKISLFAILALVTSLSAGLALTTFLLS